MLVPRSWGRAWSPLPMPDTLPSGRAAGAAVPSRRTPAVTGSGLNGVQSQGKGGPVSGHEGSCFWERRDGSPCLYPAALPQRNGSLAGISSSSCLPGCSSPEASAFRGQGVRQLELCCPQVVRIWGVPAVGTASGNQRTPSHAGLGGRAASGRLADPSVP